MVFCACGTSARGKKKSRRQRVRDLAEVAWSPMPRRGNSLSECLFAFVELAIGSYFGYVALSTSNHWYVDSREISQFVLRPSRIIFFMPPCMACLGLVVLFHDRIKSGLFKRVLKREIPDSWQSPLLEGFFRKAFVVWTVVLSALSVSLIPVHTRFTGDRKSTRLNSSHVEISYAV